MTTGLEFLRSLLEGADPDKLAAFVKGIKPQAPQPTSFEKKTQAIRSNGQVKSYTTVIKQYTCLTCDSKFSAIHNMEKGEQTFCINPTGDVKVITISGKPGELVLKSFSSHCSFCAEMASRWSHEELLRRWIALAKSCTFKEVVCCRNSVLEKE
jgi:hypothetical protein